MQFVELVRGRSVVSERGQTVIPKEVRQKLGIKARAKLLWLVRDNKIAVQVLPDDPIEALHGVAKDLDWSTEDLLAERRADRDKEEAALKEMIGRWQSTS